ncbi:FAD-binding protein [Candidatus Daviesbacteria bacterium]|nr:FAD-binding protein [Candidatus Daviesbacteria bacterium]
MDDKFRLVVRSLGDERVKLNEPLSFHTYSKLGGPAEAFYIATNQRELIRVLDLANELNLNFFILGGGTKVLISDLGIKGLVIKNRSSNIKIAGVKGKVGKDGIGVSEALVEVDSGVSIGKLNEFLAKNSLEEVTGYSALQSTIGGSIFLDLTLRSRTQKIKIWNYGSLHDIGLEDLRRENQVVLSVVFRFKAKEKYN